MEGWVELGDRLHTEVDYPPADVTYPSLTLQWAVDYRSVGLWEAASVELVITTSSSSTPGRALPSFCDPGASIPRKANDANSPQFQFPSSFSVSLPFLSFPFCSFFLPSPFHSPFPFPLPQIQLWVWGALGSPGRKRILSFGASTGLKTHLVATSDISYDAKSVIPPGLHAPEPWSGPIWQVTPRTSGTECH